MRFMAFFSRLQIILSKIFAKVQKKSEFENEIVEI